MRSHTYACVHTSVFQFPTKERRMIDDARRGREEEKPTRIAVREDLNEKRRRKKEVEGLGERSRQRGWKGEKTEEWGTLAGTPCARNTRICGGSLTGRSLNKTRPLSPLENHVLSTSARHKGLSESVSFVLWEKGNARWNRCNPYVHLIDDAMILSGKDVMKNIFSAGKIELYKENF